MNQMGWNTRLGFYFAAIGAACGLGNVWRFPYVVAEHGGGAFVLLYILLVLVIGLPLIIGELMLGKITGKSLVSAVEEVKKKNPVPSGHSKFWWKSSSLVSKMALVICLLILSYFSVVSGWVLFFVTRFAMSIVGASMDPSQSLHIILSSGWLQIFLSAIHIGIVVVIVAKGVDQGIEKWVGVMMPVFVVLLLGLAARNFATLEPTREALRFFFYPDFSRLTATSLGAAVGHVCFTLTLGFGTMVTFGSYMRQNFYIPNSGFRVAVVDLIVSIFAGLLVFPLAYLGGAPKMGPELMFEAVPRLFSWFQGGEIFGFLFFLCLYLASLGASIAILETVVANLCDTDGLNRNRAAWGLGGLCLVGSILPALGSTLLRQVQYKNRGVLELLDITLVNWLLPIIALALSQFIVYQIKDRVKRDEFLLGGGPTASVSYGHWLILMRFVIPGLIGLGLVLQLYSFF